MRRAAILLLLSAAAVSAQQPQATLPTIVAVHAITPPRTPLPPESETGGITKFSFIAYGDTRCDCSLEAPAEVETAHAQVVAEMLARIKARAGSANAIRFVLQSGDAVFRGQNAERWNDVFIPIIDQLTEQGNVPFFFSVGNHDVTGMPPGDPGRALGLHNTLSAVAKLIPPEGSPRRLNGYPTYAFGYGNTFFIAFDSNIAADTIQLAWVTDQLEHLDRTRYPNVVAFFHHPFFSSGPHSGVQPPDPVTHERGPDRVEPSTLALRTIWAPLFRKHHVRMTIAGHDHLFDHWVEHYVDDGREYRRDDVLTGGGGAPIYVYAGEPDLTAYLKGGASQQVRVQHLARPGAKAADNPHHFVIVDVDGEKLSIEVVAVGGPLAPYNGRSRIDLQ